VTPKELTDRIYELAGGSHAANKWEDVEALLAKEAYGYDEFTDSTGKPWLTASALKRTLDRHRGQIEEELKRRRDAEAALDIIGSGPMRDMLTMMMPDKYEEFLAYMKRRAGL
jgi:hypothetical protein